MVGGGEEGEHFLSKFVLVCFVSGFLSGFFSVFVSGVSGFVLGFVLFRLFTSCLSKLHFSAVLSIFSTRCQNRTSCHISGRFCPPKPKVNPTTPLERHTEHPQHLKHPKHKQALKDLNTKP